MEQGRKRRRTAAVLTAAMVLGGSISSYAAGWKCDNIGWWYENEDGTYPVSSWYEDGDGSWYFFDDRGYMISNRYQLIDGNYYPFCSDGKWSGDMFSDIAQGIWTDGNYSNEWSGFHLNLPANFSVTTAADSRTIGTSDSFVEFVVWIPDGTYSGIELEYVDAYNLPNQINSSAEDMVTLRSMVLALSGYTIKTVNPVNIGGKEYLKMETKKDETIMQDLYCRKVGDHYFECLTAIYYPTSKPFVDTLLTAIY